MCSFCPETSGLQSSNIVTLLIALYLVCQRRMLTVGRREVREFIWQIPVRLNLISCHPPIRK